MITTRQLERVAFGKIYAHAIDFNGALPHILHRVESKLGGFVVTPNVDHVCLAETDARLRACYDDAFLSLADGMPLIWSARLLKLPIREKVSGSDLVEPLLEKGATRGLRIYFLGASERVNQKAKVLLETKYREDSPSSARWPLATLSASSATPDLSPFAGYRAAPPPAHI